jgi:ssRNA-specific RNase YbeY (16S rRNA maturation enzyme)
MLLVIHGTLHLLGFDHGTAAHRAAMWAAQDTVLQALDIPLSIVPALESYHYENP